MIELKYSFEYYCFPIWVKDTLSDNAIFENISIDKLPISNELKTDLANLDTLYQSTYNDEYPAESKKLAKNEAISFCENVIDTAKRLSDELPSIYKVVFDKNHWQEKVKELNRESPS